MEGPVCAVIDVKVLARLAREEAVKAILFDVLEIEAKTEFSEVAHMVDCQMGCLEQQVAMLGAEKVLVALTSVVFALACFDMFVKPCVSV